MSRYASYLLAALLGAALTTNLHAQLVPDGGTLTFTGTTNLPGDLVVGTNAGNTLLDILAPGTVTNATGFIGYNAASTNNQVRVENSGAVWQNTGTLNVGFIGSGNQLIVTNGGVVAAASGEIGYDPSTSDNLAVVSGAGSVWTNSGELDIGVFGSGNQLMVTNGGVVANLGAGIVGYTGGANNNLVTVTGTNSQWRISDALILGDDAVTNNQVAIRDGGLVVSSSGRIGSYSADANFQKVLVADPGSLWSNSNEIYVGDTGSGNQLVINNGGTVTSSDVTVGFNATSTNNRVTLDGGTVTVTGSLTINSNNMLAGNGTINGTVINYGNLAPGNPIGKLVLNNSPTLQGSVLMEISKTGATLTNDQIQVAAPLTYGGNLVVSNLGPDGLIAGDSFTLFNASNYGGGFTNVSLPALNSGLTWTNKLLIDGSIAVIAQTSPAISGLVKSGTNLVFNVSGGSAGGAYDLLTSTNVALPLASWATNSTGNFDGLGNATITNGIDPADPQRFFTISEH